MLTHLIPTCFLLFWASGVSAFASPSIPPPPQMSMPVWSLSSPLSQTSDDDIPKSKRGDAAATSMNIVTFATAVSVAPPKVWVVSLYTNTLTRRAFLDSKVAVLQLLRPDQSALVPILGKRSGYESDFCKRDACHEAGYAWTSFCNTHDDAGSADIDKELLVLPRCASYIRLKLLSYHNAGDHDVALCEVMDTAIWSDEMESVICSADPLALDQTNALYTGKLREEGII